MQCGTWVRGKFAGIRHAASLLIVAGACSAAAPALAADWPQFRGPQSSGLAVNSAALPANIDREKHVQWQTELPPGHSSPAIVGNKIFLTAVRDGEHLETICLDRASGKILWRVEAPHTSLEKIHGIGSYAQPSPTADAERVVVLFGSSGLYCYDHDGKELWKHAMGPFNDEFGAAASPILVDDRVWKVEGRKEIVVAGMLRICGYDWETGEERWTVRGLSRVNCLTPVVGPDGTLYAAGWSAGGEPGDRISLPPFADFAFQYDTNKNGTLEPSEAAASPALKTRFAQCDRNKDGQITAAEYEEFQMLFDRSENTVVAIRPGPAGDATESHVSWKYQKVVPFCASPLVANDLLFCVKDGGILSCLDAATGQPHKSGRVTGTANYYASPVAGDGKIYLLSQRGTLSVVSSEPSWKVLHSAEFGEETYATPAIVDGRIYLRTSGRLYCFGL
ncbi:MAG: PQQ-binding-like beta-propeller repeat protein [Pirellulaceae bacterium]|nr:PQQ-binding-like beta-propeller repeat protein [Pirellulaceae bacterium]